MPTFEVVEAKLHHCGRMARLLRSEHRSAVTRIGVDAHRELRNVFAESSFRRAWLIDGHLAALGGVTGMTASVRGGIWLALSDEATRYPIHVAREARRQIEHILQVKRELTTTIVAGDQAAKRFALALGFHVSHPLPFDEDAPIINMELHHGTWQRPTPRPGVKPAPFIIYAAGRSRTAWLAAFLTYGEHRCHHEVALNFRGMDEVTRFFARPGIGTAETAASPGWRLIEHFVPGIRSVVVRRPMEDVIRSFSRIVPIDEARLRRIIAYEDRCLAEISVQPGVLTVDFADLEQPETCAAVFEHCLPYRFDFDWWTLMRHRNVQTNVADIVRAYQDNRDAVEGFKRTCKREMSALVRSGAMRRTA